MAKTHDSSYFLEQNILKKQKALHTFFCSLVNKIEINLVDFKKKDTEIALAFIMVVSGKSLQ